MTGKQEMANAEFISLIDQIAVKIVEIRKDNATSNPTIEMRAACAEKIIELLQDDAEFIAWMRSRGHGSYSSYAETYDILLLRTMLDCLENPSAENDNIKKWAQIVKYEGNKANRHFLTGLRVGGSGAFWILPAILLLVLAGMLFQIAIGIPSVLIALLGVVTAIFASVVGAIALIAAIGGGLTVTRAMLGAALPEFEGRDRQISRFFRTLPDNWETYHALKEIPAENEKTTRHDEDIDLDEDVRQLEVLIPILQGHG